MNRPLSAIAGGAAGMALLSVMLVMFEVETRSQIGLFDVIARFVGLPGQTALGFILFALAGIFAWPLLFISLENYLPLWPDPAVRGMGFAAAFWVGFIILGRGSLSGPILIMYGITTLLAHLAYGFTLGAVYARLSEEAP